MNLKQSDFNFLDFLYSNLETDLICKPEDHMAKSSPLQPKDDPYTEALVKIQLLLFFLLITKETHVLVAAPLLLKKAYQNAQQGALVF